MTTSVQRRLYGCPVCGTEALAASGAPACDRCGMPMKTMIAASAVLAEEAQPIDETLTAFLSAPLSEEALVRSGNPANRFGKYVFLRELGRGATGTVLKAWDTYLSRHVALKFLRTTPIPNVVIESTERVQCFLREARIAARLVHPNIVTIHEVDCRDGRYFISMDFIDGGSLADLIYDPADRKLPTRFYQNPARFLNLLRKIALAVHHAHSQTPPVVHRDLKPQNVLLDAHGQPIVVDFGLANEIQVDGERSEGVRGTPAYMAPEQALGDTAKIDARSDVYALGIILYEMLTGQLPFRGSNIPSILRKVVTQLPEPPSIALSRLLKKNVPSAACPQPMRDALNAICLTALAKKREDRYRSALEFADALERAIHPPAPVMAESRSKAAAGEKRKRRVAAVAAAAGILLLSLAAGRLRTTPPAAAAAQPVDRGQESALLASELLADGKWTALRGAVAELRQRAPAHPRLADFERALAARQEGIDRSRREWALALERLPDGADPADLRRRLGEFAETQDEYQAALRRAADRAGRTLFEEARRLQGDGPSDAWLSPEAKERAGALSRRLEDFARVVGSEDLGLDGRALAEARALVGKLLAYRGSWSLRANLDPYAEVRILRRGREIAREFTPLLVKSLELDDGDLELEVCWPSIADPQRRWTAPLRDLRPGERVTVSGSLERTDVRIERK